MDGFKPNKTFSSIDSGGRYAYDHQPMIGQWNLTRFAETLLKLIDKDQTNSIEIAKRSLEHFWRHFEKAFQNGLCKKIGVTGLDQEGTKLAFAFLDLLSKSEVDFTTAYRTLGDHLEQGNNKNFIKLFDDTAAIEKWLTRWNKNLSNDGKGIEEVRKQMKMVNPAFIQRNNQIEKAIDLATNTEDFSLMEDLITVLNSTFESTDTSSELSQPQTKEEKVIQTFCGPTTHFD